MPAAHAGVNDFDVFDIQIGILSESHQVAV